MHVTLQSNKYNFLVSYRSLPLEYAFRLRGRVLKFKIWLLVASHGFSNKKMAGRLNIRKKKKKKSGRGTKVVVKWDATKCLQSLSRNVLRLSISTSIY